MAATYYRPNLSKEQRIILESLVREALSSLSVDDAQFDVLYRSLIKLRDCKEIKC
jgi:hypothetical protein